MTVRIFDLDFNEIFDDAVAIYQDKTGYTLGRHDAERLMIQIFAGMIHKWGTSWLASSQQNYLEFMTDDNLDYYGDFFQVERLDSTPAQSIVRFRFTDDEPIQSATMIYANTIVSGSNDNGSYTFKVEDDTYVAAGLSYIDIDVVEFIDSDTNSGADANDIEIGDTTYRLVTKCTGDWDGCWVAIRAGSKKGYVVLQNDIGEWEIDQAKTYPQRQQSR